MKAIIAADGSVVLFHAISTFYVRSDGHVYIVMLGLEMERELIDPMTTDDIDLAHFIRRHTVIL